MIGAQVAHGLGDERPDGEDAAGGVVGGYYANLLLRQLDLRVVKTGRVAHLGGSLDGPGMGQSQQIRAGAQAGHPVKGISYTGSAVIDGGVRMTRQAAFQEGALPARLRQGLVKYALQLAGILDGNRRKRRRLDSLG